MENNSEDIANTESKNDSLSQRVSFESDIASIAISFILGVILVVLANTFILNGSLIYLLLGIFLILWGISRLSNSFTEFGSALNYRKARSELNGLYLRKSKPVCPYLKSSYQGFSCLIEFTEPFNIASDLPKCHSEEAFKDHWTEKAPNVFLKAKQSHDRNLLVYLRLLGRAKYEPAIPFITKILDTPMYDDKHLFIFKNADNKDLTTLKNEYLKNFMQEDELLDPEEKDEQKTYFEKEFSNCLDDLLNGSILINDNQILKYTEDEEPEQYLNNWKFYSNNLTKQFALVSLSLFDDKKVLPKLLEIYLKTEDNKLLEISKKGLLNQCANLEEPLIDMLDSDIPADRKTKLIDIAGTINSEKVFIKLEELSRDTNETISYYAISALGKKGSRGISSILDVLQKQPTDLNIDSGRATLSLVPKEAFLTISDYISKSDSFSDDFIQIVASILEELDHVTIKKLYNTLEDEKQKEITKSFQKHDLMSSFEYLTL